jgi:hypothetical protein
MDGLIVNKVTGNMAHMEKFEARHVQVRDDRYFGILSLADFYVRLLLLR